MKRLLSALWIAGLCAAVMPVAQADRLPTAVIFDTDIGTDIDDAYALAGVI